MKDNLFEKLNREYEKVSREVIREEHVFTIQEYMAANGVTRNTASKRLGVLVDAGKLTRTVVPIIDIGGRRQRVWGYKFTDGDTK